jgi:DNA-binding beta-propeller fold protein YncE
MPPGQFFGEGAGVAVNSHGHVFVYTRNGSTGGHIIAPQAAALYEFGSDGSFVRKVRDLYSMAWAHAVRVDKDDNVWLVDNGSDMVVKLAPDLSRVLLTLGRRRESVAQTHVHAPDPGATPAARDNTFNEPTDVTWDAQGNIFISDGYRNMSVAKFAKDGTWVKRIGKGNMAEPGSGPGEFWNPHGIVADGKGNVYVADRANVRIQVLDTDLKFLRDIKINVPPPPGPVNPFPSRPGVPDSIAERVFTPGAPWAVCITPGPRQVIYAADAYPGRIYKLGLDGEVLGYFGVAGKLPGQFNQIHAMACPHEDELYVAELSSWRVQKIKLKARSR